MRKVEGKNVIFRAMEHPTNESIVSAAAEYVSVYCVMGMRTNVRYSRLQPMQYILTIIPIFIEAHSDCVNRHLPRRRTSLPDKLRGGGEGEKLKGSYRR